MRETFETATARIEDGSYAKKSKSVFAAALISIGKLEEAAELYGNFPTYPDLDREYNIQGNFNPDESDIHLIIFWEEWCPHCFRIMSRAEKLYRQYNNYGIDVIGITALWNDGSRKKTEKFLRDRGEICTGYV